MRIHAVMRAARSTELHPAAPTWLSMWLSDQASFVYPVPNQIFGGLSDSAGVTPCVRRASRSGSGRNVQKTTRRPSARVSRTPALPKTPPMTRSARVSSGQPVWNAANPRTPTTMPSSSTVIRANGHVALIQDVRSPPVKTCLAIAAGQYARGWAKYASTRPQSTRSRALSVFITRAGVAWPNRGCQEARRAPLGARVRGIS